MSTVFSGPDGVQTFRAIAFRHALQLYARHRMRVNRAYTPTVMLRVAGEITGQTFKRGQYQQAADALGAWIAVNGTSGEPPTSRAVGRALEQAYPWGYRREDNEP